MAPTCCECLLAIPFIMAMALAGANTVFYRWYSKRIERRKMRQIARGRAKDYEEYANYVRPGIQIKYPTQLSTLSQKDQIKYLKMQLQQSVTTIAKLEERPCQPIEPSMDSRQKFIDDCEEFKNGSPFDI